jgi:hypothetical protein
VIEKWKKLKNIFDGNRKLCQKLKENEIKSKK